MALYDEILSQLQARDPLPPLFPTQCFSRDISQQILHSSDVELLGGKPFAHGKPRALRTGLLLLNDEVGRAHSMVYRLQPPVEAFWRGVIHRREGVAGYSEFWWNSLVEHRIFEPLFEEATWYLQYRTEPEARDFAAKMDRAGCWNPVDFVRACSNADDDDEWLRGLQMIEISTLLDWCRFNA